MMTDFLFISVPIMWLGLLIFSLSVQLQPSKFGYNFLLFVLFVNETIDAIEYFLEK